MQEKKLFRFYGKVIIQSYSPDRESIALSVKGQTDEFYRNELESRRITGFPPWTRLVRLVFRSMIKDEAEKAAADAAELLRKKAPGTVDVLGPAECPLLMVSGNYRFQIMLRGESHTELRNTAAYLATRVQPRNVYLEIDMDPLNML